MNDTHINAIELLEREHQEVSDNIKAIETAIEEKDNDRCQDLFDELKDRLEAHAKIEEDHMYPALESYEETKSMAAESRTEHNLVKNLLDEMDGMDTDQEEWDAKMKVLKENIEHHVHEEEGTVFPKAKEIMSEDDLKEIGQKMAEERKKFEV